MSLTSIGSRTITDPSNLPVEGAVVIARLRPVASAIRVDDLTAMSGELRTVTNSSGYYQFILERNGNLTPANTYWEIEERVPRSKGGTQVWAVVAGATNFDIAQAGIVTIPDFQPQTPLTVEAGDLRYLGIGNVGDVLTRTGIAQVVESVKVFNVNTLIDKGSQVYDVRAFDTNYLVTTAGIALAVAEAGPEGRIFIPKGLHVVTVDFNQPGLTVEASRGARLTQVAGSTTIAKVTADGVNVNKLQLIPAGTFSGTLAEIIAAKDVTLDEMIFDGSAATTDFGRGVALSSGSDRAMIKAGRFKFANGAVNHGFDAIFAQDSAEMSVMGGYIKGGRNRGIDARSTSNLSVKARVEGVNLSNIASHAVLLWNGNAKVTDNIIDNCGGSGVFITGDPFAGATNKNTTVDGNVITNCALAIDLENDVKGANIEGNTAEACGISLTKGTVDSLVEGNNVRNVANNSYGGIYAPRDALLANLRNSFIGNDVSWDNLSTLSAYFIEDGAGSYVDNNKGYNAAVGLTVNSQYAPNTEIGTNDFDGCTALYSGAAVKAYLKPISIPDLSDLETWLDASSINGLADGAAVATWYDLSTKGRNAVQAVGANQPLYKVGIFNGRPVLRFDGVNDLLAQVAFGAISQPFTVIAVLQATAGALTDGIVASPNRISLGRNTSQVYQITADGGGVLSGSTGIADTRSVLVAVFNGAFSYMRANGHEGAMGNPGAGKVAGLTLGNNYFNGAPMAGDIAEFIVYSQELKRSSIMKLERYLGFKYGITVV